MGKRFIRGRMPFVGLVLCIVVYLAVIIVAHAVATSPLDGLDYGRFPDVETIVRATIVPVGLSVLFCAVIVQIMGWWKPVLRNDPPVQRWVLVVPLVLIAAIATGTDYGTLSDRGASFTAWLLAGSLLIGLGEELMFRGIAVASMRLNGRKESTIALWTSLLFGLAHSVNWFVDGGGHVVQLVATAFMGWFLYLTRRATRGLLVPVLIHGLWDFGLFAGNVTTDLYWGGSMFVLAQLVLIPVVVIKRRSIERV